MRTPQVSFASLQKEWKRKLISTSCLLDEKYRTGRIFSALYEKIKCKQTWNTILGSDGESAAWIPVRSRSAEESTSGLHWDTDFPHKVRCGFLVPGRAYDWEDEKSPEIGISGT